MKDKIINDLAIRIANLEVEKATAIAALEQEVVIRDEKIKSLEELLSDSEGEQDGN